MAKSDGEMFSFISGLVVGLVFSVPVAAWLSPRSGEEARHGIAQRGMIIRRRVGETIRKPIQQVQDQLKGDSLQEALDEGKTIAARLRSDSRGE